MFCQATSEMRWYFKNWKNWRMGRETEKSEREWKQEKKKGWRPDNTTEDRITDPTHTFFFSSLIFLFFSHFSFLLSFYFFTSSSSFSPSFLSKSFHFHCPLGPTHFVILTLRDHRRTHTFYILLFLSLSPLSLLSLSSPLSVSFHLSNKKHSRTIFLLTVSRLKKCLFSLATPSEWEDSRERERDSKTGRERENIHEYVVFLWFFSLSLSLWFFYNSLIVLPYNSLIPSSSVSPPSLFSFSSLFSYHLKLRFLLSGSSPSLKSKQMKCTNEIEEESLKRRNSNT